MLEVALKYELFGGSERCIEELNKFKHNFEILKSILKEIEEECDFKSERPIKRPKYIVELEEMNQKVTEILQHEDVVFGRRIFVGKLVLSLLTL